MIKGGCQCGNVIYESDGEISDLSHCHCSMCRKLHGAAFTTFAGVARDGFRWSGGEDTLGTYASSEKTDRMFCQVCGSQLAVFFTPEPNLVYLTMGTVEGNPDCPPDYHQFAASKAPWHEITDGKPQHDAWPDD